MTEYILPEASIVALELRDRLKFLRNSRPDWPVDVRLQVTGNDWQIHEGDASYDTDHYGHWGSSSLCEDTTDSELTMIAEDLLSQVEESIAEEV